MSVTLIQSAPGVVPVYLEHPGCIPSTGLTAYDVTVSLKKSTGPFLLKTLAPVVNASASFGAGANGVVTLGYPGTAGNAYSVTVTVPTGTSGLSVSVSPGSVQVALAVSAGVPIAGQNTALLIANAINALASGVVASHSGDGSTDISVASGPTTFSGGVDGDWYEIGGGYYSLNLSTTDTNTVGPLFVRVAGPSFNTTIIPIQVVASVTPPSPVVIPIPQVILYGYVYDGTGSPISGAIVQYKVLSIPTIAHPGTEGIGLSNDLLTSKTDSSGYWMASLVPGSQIDIFIPVIGYRRIITVPTATANLLDIP